MVINIWILESSAKEISEVHVELSSAFCYHIRVKATIGIPLNQNLLLNLVRTWIQYKNSVNSKVILQYVVL